MTAVCGQCHQPVKTDYDHVARCYNSKCIRYGRTVSPKPDATTEEMLTLLRAILEHVTPKPPRSEDGRPVCGYPDTPCVCGRRTES